MKNLLVNTTKGLVAIVASAILTALITGQPLTGLTKVKGIYRTFVQSSVPAWAFSLVFLCALFGTYYALSHLRKRRPRGKVHFIPDAHNCGWSKQTDREMNVRIGGTFTYDISSELIVLKAYLKGTHPRTDLMVHTEAPDGSNRMTETSELWLRGCVSKRTFIEMRLEPVLGTPGRPLRCKLILVDKFSRPFVIGPIDLPYLGPRT